MNQKQFLLEAICEIGVKLTDVQAEQFIKCYELLVSWNQKMNLTAITEYEEVVRKHFVDSLSVVKCYDFQNNWKVLDLGTGAGFPGVPLKIVYPHLKMTLLDSLNKRIRFLNEVIAALQLTDIQTIHARAEDFARQPAHREQYDVCLSRAVANLSTLSEYCLPCVKPNGYFFSYKAGDCKEEICNSKKAITVLGGEITAIEKFTLPKTDINRCMIAIKKTKRTPSQYPRKAGMPTKHPII